ncbi:MAG TPA: hypothetical protein VFC19_23250 [Candidatus Limnocylindrales bacterium]|nr:hypothetical protein [Candidatus Limnocylindrales bacterium]
MALFQVQDFEAPALMEPALKVEPPVVLANRTSAWQAMLPAPGGTGF